MKSVLSSIDFTKFEESQPAIQVLFGAFKVSNSSNIHNQDVFLNSFASDIEMSDSGISDITVNEPSVELVSSTFSLTNMNFENIFNPNDNEFIFITFDSEFHGSNITYSDSSSILFNVLSSKAFIDGISFNNINSSQRFLKMRD